MKYLILAITAFTIAGCASQQKETDPNLCDINLNKISNYKAQFGLTTGEPERSQIATLYKQAQDYKTANDVENCIATSEQALSIINTISTSK